MSMSSSVPAHGSRSRYAAGRPAVTPDRIVDAAVQLTTEHGLHGWTLRGLAAALDSYPAVIYHHIGSRDDVTNAVVERVVGMVPPPIPGLGWREWFRVLLGELRSVLRPYRGVARQLAIQGVTVTSAGRIIDQGVRLLQHAGFGEESVLAYNLLLTTACQFIAIEDDREETVPQRRQLAGSFAAAREQTELPGLAAMGEFVHGLMQTPGAMDGYFASFYDYAIGCALDGVAARLDRINASG